MGKLGPFGAEINGSHAHSEVLIAGAKVSFSFVDAIY